MRNILKVVAIAGLFVLSAAALTPTDDVTSGVPLSIGFQTAYADSTGLENPKSVAETKLYAFSRGRPRMTLVWGDTAWTKIVVPALDDGDFVTSVLRCDTGGGTAALTFLDITDSCYFDADTIQPWVATDSGAVLLLFNDVD